jgi:hypothetical protein
MKEKEKGHTSIADFHPMTGTDPVRIDVIGLPFPDQMPTYALMHLPGSTNNLPLITVSEFTPETLKNRPILVISSLIFQGVTVQCFKQAFLKTFQELLHFHTLV